MIKKIKQNYKNEYGPREQYSISYKNNDDLDRYDVENTKFNSHIIGEYNSYNKKVYGSFDGTDVLNTQFDYESYQKKIKWDDYHWGSFTPLSIIYHENGKVKSIKNHSFHDKTFSKTYHYFHNNGKIKKYIDFLGFDSEEKSDENEVEPSPFISGGGYYVEFHDSGSKRCEGCFEYIHKDNKDEPTMVPPEPRLSKYELEDMDTDQRFSYNEMYSSDSSMTNRELYRCKLWIFYDKKGNILFTIDYSKYRGRIKLFEGYGQNNSLDTEDFVQWVDGTEKKDYWDYKEDDN